MSGKKSYSELLLDPRWQRRRLEILQRADFQCEDCGAADKTLHVHHLIYRKGAMPWVYTNDELRALCCDCHDVRHALKQEIDAALATLGACEPERLDEILGYLRGRLILAESDNGTLRGADIVELKNDRQLIGCGNALGLDDAIGYQFLIESPGFTKHGFVEIYHEVLRMNRARRKAA